MKIDKRSIFQPLIVSTSALLLATGTGAGPEGPPTWAYGTAPGSVIPANVVSKPKPDTDNSLKHLAGSTFAFTKKQINDPYGLADWFPDDHPKMPEVVARGVRPQVWACSLCHYPNGKGRPENASVNGFPTRYFIEQMNEFRNGERRSADPRKKNTNLMISYAKLMTEQQIREAADYFGAMKWTQWIKVVETTTVPKTRLSVGMFLPLEGAGSERLGQRIIEMPLDAEQTEGLRNPRSGFVAYVPIGSIEKGKTLVTERSGKTIQCGDCHGADLRGLGPVPGIAGRSPSYLVRQLYDMQQGTRKGQWTELMKPVVSRLSEADMLNIAAYTASVAP
jgi:cytochrome c553